MKKISNFDYDFLTIIFENFESFKFPSHVIDYLFLHEENILSEENNKVASSHLELVLSKNALSEGARSKPFENQTYSIFERIHDSSDICEIILENSMTSEKISIEIVWDNTDEYNYSTNYWQTSSLLEDSSLKIIFDPSLDKSTIFNRVSNSKQNLVRNANDFNLLSEASLDLKNLTSQLPPSELQQEFIIAIEKIDAFIHNNTFNYINKI